MHKNKYDHNILLNDIQKLDKIQHKHSLVAIQFPDTSAEKKYLVYYDERWDCKLFLNYKTVDRADEESVINKVSADLNVDKSQINCRYISLKVQEKYSESHQENRIYNHRLYEIKIQVFPEDEQKENFVVNGRHYYWMSISDKSYAGIDVKLKDYLIYLSVGDAFDPNAYFDSADKEGELTVQSNVNTAKAGS